jgi:hypothetical protein
VLVEGDAIDGKKHCIWIEIKYKKYLTSSDSGLGSFKSEWQEDLEKLRRPRQGQWHSNRLRHLSISQESNGGEKYDTSISDVPKRARQEV